MSKYYSYNRNGCKITFECADANITNEIDRFIQRIIDAENYRTLHAQLLERVKPLGERSEEFDRENLREGRSSAEAERGNRPL